MNHRTPASTIPQVETQQDKGPMIRSKDHPKKAPFLAADGSRLAVVISKGHKKVHYAWIENSNASRYFIKARHDDIAKFEKQYDFVTNYGPARAAAMFVTHGEQHGVGPSVLKALKAIAVGHQYEPPTEAESEGDDEMATKKKAVKSPAKKAAGGTKTSARKRLSREDIIRVVAKENPWREGSKGHKFFGIVKDGMTVEDYVKKGGELPHLQYDVKRGTFKLEPSKASA